jgi:hypothetical protein
MTYEQIDPPRFDSTTGTYRADHNGASESDVESLLLDVVTAVAEIKDVPTTELPPIRDVVDTEQVKEHLSTPPRDVDSSDLRFGFDESMVTITDREVVIRPATDE